MIGTSNTSSIQQRIRAFLFATLCVLLASTANAETLTGRVVKVADGDTLTLLDASNVPHKIRISGIDAPERKQAFDTASKKNMSALASGKEAEAICYKRDRYKRLICTVYVNREDVALAQLDAGLAWWYRKYANEQPPSLRGEYESAEDHAAADMIGLWRDNNRVPPWQWRRREK
jgi:endonuclease YncB( thermonuclease family)